MAIYVREDEFRGSGNLFFGVEHEISLPGYDDFCDFRNADNYGELVLDYKDDCSVTDYGLEYVTRPCTLSFFKAVKWEIEARMERLKQSCAEVNGSAGIHVHMSRNAFTEGHLYKFAKFVRDNEDALRGYAGRGRCDHNHRNYERADRDDAYLHQITDYYESCGRGLPNLGLEHTVEMRIFATTLDADVYLANIQYCHGLFMYTKFQPLSELSWFGFESFMCNTPEYEEFQRIHWDKLYKERGVGCVLQSLQAH